MPKIANLIPPQNYELIRDRIADILIDEIQGQINLGSDISSDLPGALYTEKHIPFDTIQLPCIKISLATGKYSNKDALKVDGTYDYYIDILDKSKANKDSDGDELASKKVQRIAGVVRTILESPMYDSLGFVKPFLANLGISEIAFGTPNDNDEGNIQVARLTFTVRVPEKSKFIATPPIIYDYVTQVSIADSPAGYVFGGQGNPNPIIPTCSPATLQLNGYTFTTINSGSTKNVQVLDQDGNPVGSADGNTWKVETGSSSFESQFEYLNIYE